MKLCLKCHKNDSGFYADKRRGDGLASQCKDCIRSKQKEHYHNPLYGMKDKTKNKHLKKFYGITLHQHNDIFEKQGKQCAACGSIDPGGINGWHTDHDHATGRIRGILCHHCNVALGSVMDSIERLKRLIIYLEKFQSKL